jgi:hypothetical protein
MRINLQRFSFRFAEQLLNSKLKLKQEIEDILLNSGIDLLKFQVASYSSLDKIDVGVYIVSTQNFQKRMKKEFKQNWEGSLTFEKVKEIIISRANKNR